MKTNNLIKVCGSIVKVESLLPLVYNIQKNTCVAEAINPYDDYYGMVPHEAIPNSLFFFTTEYNSLEEILLITQNIDACYMEKVNIASASLIFSHRTHYAIRVKHFPDYDHIPMLQDCFIKEGIKFIDKINIPDTAVVKVNKCFVLEEKEEGIYIDQKEKHKGYITIPGQISDSEFSEILTKLKYNRNCKIFDAALGAMIIDSKAKNMIRIYSENLDVNMLTCIEENFNKYMEQKRLIEMV